MEYVCARGSRRSERSRQGLASAAGLLTLLGLASCYARSFPLAETPLPAARSSEAPIGFLVGLRAAEEGENVFRIRQGEVVERFAARLEEAGLFDGVIHPVGPQTGTKLPLLLELEVRSRYDLHGIRNLVQDLVAGVTLLALQPLLPTTWDLEIGIRWRARGSDGRVVSEQRVSDLHRFESDWLFPPEAAVADWHAQAIESALQKLIASLRSQRAELAAAGKTDPLPRSTGP